MQRAGPRFALPCYLLGETYGDFAPGVDLLENLPSDLASPDSGIETSRRVIHGNKLPPLILSVHQKRVLGAFVLVDSHRTAQRNGEELVENEEAPPQVPPERYVFTREDGGGLLNSVQAKRICGPDSHAWFRHVSMPEDAVPPATDTHQSKHRPHFASKRRACRRP